MKYAHTVISSPVGKLKLVASEVGLAAILWIKVEEEIFPGSIEDGSHPLLLETEKQLKEYFAGKRTSFDLPLAAEGTDFQKKVWKLLSRIPYGETRSYGEIAQQLGNPKAMRAVGAANGKNPLSIVVPCHRVIGANGKLTGFGGGLDNKDFLLKLESPQRELERGL